MIASLVVAALTCLSGSTETETWPGWRGPGGNGAADGSPPISWGEDQNVRWRAALPGKGSSSPIVWGDHVFVTSAVSVGEAPKSEEPEPGRDGGRGRGGRGVPPVEQDFLVMALSRKDGEVLWEAVANTLTPHQGTHSDGTYATPTPVTDGEILIASFGSFGLFAFDYSGELLWEKDLGDMDIMNSFGEGASPVLHGDLLIHPWDNDGESFLVALDKRTGEEKWRVARESTTTWCTPLVVEGTKGPEVIMAAARTISYDLSSGDVRWAFGGDGNSGAQPTDDADERKGESGDADGEFKADQPQMMQQGRGQDGRSWGGAGNRRTAGVMTSPVVNGGVLLMSTGGRRGSFRAIDITKAKGELAEKSDAILWIAEGDTPGVPSPVAHDGLMYSLKGSSGLLSAFDVKSGERLYGPERLEGVANVYASPVVAGGHLYFVGRDGTFEVVKTGPEFESVAVNRLEDEFDASPAVVGDELFLRGSSSVYCIAKDE